MRGFGFGVGWGALMSQLCRTSAFSMVDTGTAFLITTQAMEASVLSKPIIRQGHQIIVVVSQVEQPLQVVDAAGQWF